MRFGRKSLGILALLAMAFPPTAGAQDAFADLPPIPPTLKRQFEETGVDQTFWRLGKMRWEVANRLLDIGRVDDARALYDELVADSYRNPLDIALGRAGIARIAAFDGRHEDAAKMFAAARQALIDAGLEKEQRGVGLTYVGWVVIDEAGALHRLGRDGEALKLIDAQLALESDFLGRTAPLVDARATALEGLGRFSEAEGARTRSLQMLRVAQVREAGVRPIDVAAAEVRLAANLVAQGKGAQAEPLLGSALAVYAVRLDPAHPDALDARAALAQLRLVTLRKPSAALDELRLATSAILSRSDSGRPDQRADNRLNRYRDLFRGRVAAGWAVSRGDAGAGVPTVTAPSSSPLKPRRAAVHGEAVEALAFSPDGKRLVSGGADGSLILWDVATGAPVAQVTDPAIRRMERLGYLPDGRFWTASTDGKIRIWSADATDPEVAFDFAEAGVGVVALLSPDGRTAVIADPGKQLTIIDRASGRRATAPLEWARVEDIAFSPDGRSILLGEWTAEPDSPAGSGESRICLHAVADAKRGACRAVFTARSLHYGPDGKSIIVAAFSGPGDRFDAVTLAPAVEGGRPQSGDVFTLSPDGTRAAASADDGGVRITDVATGAAVARLDGHTGDVTTMAFSPDGTLVATGSKDRTVRLWQVAEGRSLHVLGDASGFARHMGEIRNVAFSADGRRVLSGALDNARLWDAQTGVQLATYGGWSVGFSPDGKRLLAGGEVRDAATGQVVQKLQTDGWTGAYLTNGMMLVSVGEATRSDPHLAIVDPQGRQTGRIPWTFGDRLLVAPRGDLVAVAGSAGAFRVWNSRTGKPATETVSNPGLRLYGFTATGGELMLGMGSAIGILDVADQSAVRRIFLLPNWFTYPQGVSLAGDGNSLIAWNSAAAYRAIGVTPPPKGAPPPPPGSLPQAVALPGKGTIRALLLSADGTRVAIGYADGDLAFVDTATGAVLNRVRAHAGEIEQLVPAPDGRHLLSVGKDRTMTIWSMEKGTPTVRLGD